MRVVQKQTAPIAAPSELVRALAACRASFFTVGAISAVLNVLALGGSFFMLLVYDRVLPSRSVPTLVGLVVLVLVVYVFQALLEVVRSGMLVKIGSSLELDLSRRVYDVLAGQPLRASPHGDGLLPVRDLDQIRAFVSGAGPSAFFDLPFLALFLAILFGFHPLLGVTTLAGAIVLFLLTLLTDRLTREASQETSGLTSARNALAGASRRNAEVLHALGMVGQGGAAWTQISSRHLAAQQKLATLSSRMNGVTKVLRLSLQSMVLAVGAYLVINDMASGGVIIASSILSSRALAPIEGVIANWRGLVAARQSWARLGQTLKTFPPEDEVMPLPPPRATLAVEGVGVAPPGGDRQVVLDVTFSLRAGDALGLIGPSGSGKSSLARALVGVWRPVRGVVRLDGAALDQWSSDALGRHIGYLPQDIELFEGTVAQNIARFEPAAPADAVIASARSAAAHEMIVRLPGGYETAIGPNGASLSAGQRQRVALARALYRDPFLVVLDEPNSNLDAEGDAALSQAIAGVRARGGIVVIVAHRPSALGGIDLVAVLADGRLQAFGPKAEVMAKVMAPRAQREPGHVA